MSVNVHTPLTQAEDRVTFVTTAKGPVPKGACSRKPPIGLTRNKSSVLAPAMSGCGYRDVARPVAQRASRVAAGSTVRSVG